MTDEAPARPICFVIGPIGNDGSTARKHSDLLFHALIEPALGSQYQCLRADMEQKSGIITDSIIQRITDSDLVVADFTTLNPNVLYELGIRHASSRPTIHMAADGTTLPFDNAGSRTIFFDLTDWFRIVRARQDLVAQAIDTRSPNHNVSNPVTKALTTKAFRASSSTEENALAELSDRISRLEDEQRERPASAQGQIVPRGINATQLVETIEQESRRIGERRQILEEALKALAQNGHVSASQQAFDDYANKYARSVFLYNAFIKNVESTDYDDIQSALNEIEDIPF